MDSEFMVDEQFLITIRVLYLGIFIGVLAFLLIWEGGKPIAPFASARERGMHVARNLAMLFWVIVIADYVVGQWLFHAQDVLLAAPGIIFHAGSLPIYAQIALGFLASDLLDYALHRLGHRVPWLWRLHSVHHSDPVLDATTAGRAHPLELSFHVVCKVGLYILLGLPLWIEGLRASLHNGLSMLQHANVRFPGWVESIRALIVTPAMHRLHHDRRREIHDSNYGVIFSFWDRLFGSYTDPDRVAESSIGLKGYEGARWQSVTGMMLTPARKLPSA